MKREIETVAATYGVTATFLIKQAMRRFLDHLEKHPRLELEKKENSNER